jgi:hypothetical protein
MLQIAFTGVAPKLQAFDRPKFLFTVQIAVVTIYITSFNIKKKMLRSAHTVYLCVLCGFQNKQRLFPYTALTDWFV